MTIQTQLDRDAHKIIARYENGESTIKIAESYNCNSGTIWIFLQRYNVEMKRCASKNYGTVKYRKQEILDLWNQGLSGYRIGKQLGIAKITINRYLKRWGCDASKHRKRDPDKVQLKDRAEEAIKLYESGLSHNEIGAKMGYSGGSVCILLQKYSIKARPIATYTVIEDYFKIIDTQEKAYILGWIYSDGNIKMGGGFRISILATDGYVLEWIKEEMKYTGPLYYNKQKEGNRQPQTEICINRKVLSDDLLRLGCPPAKSMILKFPTQDQVPNHLLHHFVRGYSDGDGNINIRGPVMIVGTYDFTIGLKNNIPCEITNIYQRYKDRPLRESSHQLYIGRKAEYTKFLNWLYKDASCYLIRKYEKALPFLNEPCVPFKEIKNEEQSA